MARSGTSTPLLAASRISKQYGAVVALRDVNVSVAPGEIHALLGANGAGKSTFVKILAGVIRPDEGAVQLAGHAVSFRSPREASNAGVACMFQDSALVPHLSIRDNLKLARLAPDDVCPRLEEFGLTLHLGERAEGLPLATRRLIELAIVLARTPKLLVLDEPTASLPSDLAARLFETMRELRKDGVSVLFITHRLAEVVEICDQATILRDGADVQRLVPAEAGASQIVSAMLGEIATASRGDLAARATPAASESKPRTAPAEDRTPMLEVRDLRSRDGLNGVDLTVEEGEIVGIVALEGQGQDALFELLSGRRRPGGGSIMVRGRELRARSAYDAIRAGLAMVPGDRLEALLPQRSVEENLTLALHHRVRQWGPIRRSAEQRVVAGVVSRLAIDTRASREARNLSGGNQQKVVLGRWLAAGFELMLCFDPTRGIDVGTKREIYELLREIVASGRSVLMFTSELEEIPLVCDRVLVMYDGRVVAELDASTASEAEIMRAAHGIVTPDLAA